MVTLDAIEDGAAAVLATLEGVAQEKEWSARAALLRGRAMAFRLPSGGRRPKPRKG
jgi:hypothetical protein